MPYRILFFIILTIFPICLFSQNASLTGTVKDETGPVPFATVVLKKGEYYTITDQNGHFIINNLPRGSYTAEISSMGYKTHKENFTISEEKSTIELSVLMTEDYKELEEVVITGLSRATLIRENPIPVTALSYEQINLNPQNNIIDALVKNSAGLTVLKTGPNISKPFIRGLGYNRVLTLFDGIRQEGQEWGDEHGLEIDDYNVSRAEIIKGPLSLMFGSDALAGVISFFSHIPNYNDNSLHGNFLTEYHTNNGLVGNAIRLGLNNSKYVFAMSGSHRLSQNYQNPVDGRVYMTNFSEINFTTLAGIKSERGYTNLHFTLYDNRQGIPDGSRDPVTRQFTKQIYEDDLDDDENRPIVSEKELKSYKISDIHTYVQHYRLYMNSFYELPKGDITINIAGQQNLRREFNHPTMPKQAGMYIRLNTINYDLRYNAPPFSNIEITTGINGIGQTNKVLDATEIPIPNYGLFDIGTFVYAKWKKDDWTLNGGIRYDFRNEGWDDFYLGIDPVTGFTKQVDKNFPDAELQFPGFNKNFHDFSASLGTTYRINRELSLKASIGRAYRAPNITELASNGLDPGAAIYYKGDRNFNPEVSLQQNIGISGNFKNFSGEVSLFNNDIDNFIFLKAVEGDDGNPKTDHQGNRYYDYKQSKAQLYGGEAWLSIHPASVKGLKFFNSLSMVYGFNRDKEFKGEKNQGEYLSLISPLNFRSDISYEIKLKKSRISSLTPNINMEYSAKQDRYLGLSGTETMTPSYTLVNMGIIADFSYSQNNNLQLIVQGNNIFDKAYQAHLSRLKYLEDHGGNGIYNMGRNIIMKLILPF